MSVLKQIELRRYLYGSAAMTVAWTMLATIVGYQVYKYQLDHNPDEAKLSLGLIGLAEAIPFISLALFGGYLADWVERKKMIMVSLTAYLFCVLALLGITINISSITAQFGLVPIYVVVMLTGVCRSLYSPARSALLGQMANREQIVAASTWSGIVYDISAISGPTLGGLIFGYFGAEATYYVIFAFGLFSLFSFTQLGHYPLPPKMVKEPIFQSLTAGVKYVFGKQELVGALALDMFAVLFGGAIAMLPAFAEEVLHCGEVGYGWLRAAPAIGSVIMGFYLANNPPKKKAGPQLFWSVAGFGVCMMLFGLSTNYALSFALLALSGVFDAMSVVIRLSVVQLFSPDAMRGRIDAVNKIFIGSSNEIGAFESGLAANYFSLVPSVVGGAAITLCFVGFFAWRLPKLRKLELP